jgi:hypothetical protein
MVETGRRDGTDKGRMLPGPVSMSVGRPSKEIGTLRAKGYARERHESARFTGIPPQEKSVLQRSAPRPHQEIAQYVFISSR